LCERTLGIEKAFGVKRYTLMRRWSAYEIAQTRKRERLIRVRRVLAGGVRCGRRADLKNCQREFIVSHP